MTDFSRLRSVGAFLALAAVLTSTHVWGDAAKRTTDSFRSSTGQITPEKGDRSLTDDLALSKFSQGGMVTYQTTTGDTLFALQIKPKLEAGPARPRDFLVLADTSASQVGPYLAAARDLASLLDEQARPEDRIDLWTVNTPAATRSLTRGFQAPKSAAMKEALQNLKMEVPLGDTDLKEGIRKALASLQAASKAGRQPVLLFLGDGMSLHNPVTASDRARLSDEMVKAGVAFLAVPLGPQLDPANLHGLASATGGTVVRVVAGERAVDNFRRIQEAVDVPVLYPTAFRLPAEVTEVYPTRLPPLRADAPTLVVGKIKPCASLKYAVEGEVAGKPVQFEMTDPVTEPAPENFFLAGMVSQWKNGKDQPALLRADRALALAEKQNQLARADLLAQAQWALGDDKLDAAKNLFNQVKQLDPQDVEADAGLKVVEKLRTGALKKDQLKDLVVKADGMALKIEKQQKDKQGKDSVKVTRDRLLALARQDDKDKPAPPPPPKPDRPLAEQEDLLQVQKQRLAIEEQRTRQVVEDAERMARQTLPRDPDAAQEELKRVLAQVRDNSLLTETLRRELVNRLEGMLRNVATQGMMIRREQDEAQRRLADARRRFELEEARVADEERIRRRMQEFQALYLRGRYENAQAQALAIGQDAIASGMGVPQAAVAAYKVATTAHYVREWVEMRRQREEKWMETLMLVERSAIPFPDEPPIQYPPAAFWREITALRKDKYISTGFAEDDPVTVRKIRDMKNKLSRPVTLDQGLPPNTTLKDALEFFTDRYDLTILVDTEAFKSEGLADVESQPVRLPKMVGVPLSTVLRLTLAQIGPPAGTYIVRPDFVEVTTGTRAITEKVVRVYPVADLVIPIPASVDQQSLRQQSQLFFGSGAGGGGFGASVFGIAGGGFLGFPGLGALGGGLGALGGGLGALGGALGGFGGALGAGALGGQLGQLGNLGLGGGGQQNLGVQGGAFGIGGGQLGQFGNLGGQFGLQGGNQSNLLILLIRQVIGTAKDWRPLTGINQGVRLGGLPPGINQPSDEEPSETDPNLWNDLGFYPPAQALVVKATSRIHTNLGGGLLSPRPNAAGALQGANDMGRPGALVLSPRKGDGDRPKQVAKAADKTKDGQGQIAKKQDARNTAAELAKLDPKKIWEDALVKGGVNDPGLIVAVADFLTQMQKFEHVAEFLKATLRQGIVARPWVYESLALALEASGGSPEEIERARVSAADAEPLNAGSYVRAAKALADQKHYDRAVAFCRQAALLEPNSPTPYADALVYAELGKDTEAMEWAAGRLLRQDWPTDSELLHAQASGRLDALAKTLQRDNKQAVAERMLTSVKSSRQRDLVLTLSWQGEADLDLEVREPIGTTCSCLQRQTPGGGTLLGDTSADMQRETYIAAEGFSGEYQVTVRRIWGRPLGGKATLEIIQHQGTPQETRKRETIIFDRTHTLAVTLDEGRRTEAASVPPPAATRRTATAAKTPSSDSVLNKLRALADPEIVGTERTRMGLGSTGHLVNNQEPPAQADRNPADLVTYQTRVSPFVSSGSDFTAQAVLSADRRYVRFSLNAVFQTVGRGGPPSVPNPFIPGMGGDPRAPN
jgi:hypothetical protein